jgi:hypothetical protein
VASAANAITRTQPARDPSANPTIEEIYNLIPTTLSASTGRHIDDMQHPLNNNNNNKKLYPSLCGILKPVMITGTPSD